MPWRAALVTLLLYAIAGAGPRSRFPALALTWPAIPKLFPAQPVFDYPGSSSPLSISYTFAVDKTRPSVDDSLRYTLTIWNDPLLSDTLRSVEAEFNLPRLENGNFALILSSFHYTGGFPLTLDATEGRITWQLGDLVRHRSAQPADTARIVFSFRIAEVNNFALSCGENPITAFARTSFVDSEGQRIFPGTPRAAESTLFLTPDFVAQRLESDVAEIQHGDTLSLQYFFSNSGNIGRRASCCLRLPAGLDRSDLLSVLPDSISVSVISRDSVCLDLGFIAAGSVQSFTLSLATARVSAGATALCFAGEIHTDCDIQPDNNAFARTCVMLAPLDLLQVQKRGDRDRLHVGDTLHYTLDFTNLAAHVPAWHVTLVDTLPPGLDFVSATPPYALANGVLLWQWAQLPAGGKDAVGISVRVRPDFFAHFAAGQACLGANFTNSTAISATAADGTPSPEAPSFLHNNRATYTAFVEPLGDMLEVGLAVTALPPATLTQLAPGDTLLYELSYFNRNEVLPATAVSVIDTLPAPEYVRLLETPAGFVYDAVQNLLRQDNLTLPPLVSQKVSYRLVVRPEAAHCTAVTLATRAAVYEMQGWDCQLANNRASHVLDLPARANLLALAVQANTALLPGEELEVVLQARNESDLRADSLTIVNVLPAALEIVVINDGGVEAGLNQIYWRTEGLAAHQSHTFSFRARARDSVYCAAATASNVAWLSSTTRDCRAADDTARTALTILPTPPAQQPRLLATSVRTRDENGDGCAEPGERVVAQITIVNRNARNLEAREIGFLNPCATLGGVCAAMTLINLAPATIAANDSTVATFEFVILENDFSAPAILLSFEVTAPGFCPQAVMDLPVTDTRYCPHPEVVLRLLDLNDKPGNNDGLASENEPLDLLVLVQNTGPLAADSADLFVTLTPANFSVLESNSTLPAGMPMHWRLALPPGTRDSVAMKIRYDSFSDNVSIVLATAHVQVSANAGPQPAQSDQLAIQRNCYARPNPFIPARHNGVLFATRQGQRVEIFDLQGNFIRALITPGPWDGRDERGRLCEPGTYIWRIAQACQGAIVVVR